MIKIGQKELENSTGAWARGQPERTVFSISFSWDRIKHLVTYVEKASLKKNASIKHM